MSRILQWKYTACEYNIEQANGFYTYSMSEGITVQEKEELVARLGSYTAPDHLPYQPNPDELKMFPLAFASFRLESGRSVVARTAAVGRDYSGSRWGNFFSHALILENGQWPIRPIELYHNANFSAGLTESEAKIGRKPDPLPILPINSLKRNGLLSFEKTYEFLFRTGKTDLARELLAALIRASTGGPGIVLSAAQEEIPLWIALVQHSLPLNLALEVPFITYAHNPLNTKRFLISGTSLEGSAFDFNSVLCTRQVEAFDFEHPELRIRKGASSLYANEMIPEKPQNPETIRTRLKFIERFEQRAIDENLDNMAALQGLLYSNIVPENDNILAATLKLARERIHASFLLEIVTALAKRAIEADLEITKTIIRFALDVVIDAEEDSDAAAPSPERKAAATILVRYIPSLVVRGELKDIAELFRFVRGLFPGEDVRSAPICLEAFMQNRKITENPDATGLERELTFVLGLCYAMMTEKSRYRTEISQLLSNELSILPDPVYFEARRKLFAVISEMRIPLNPEQHASLVTAFSHGNCEELFMKSYIRAFVEEESEPWKNSRTAGPMAESFLEFYLKGAKINGSNIGQVIRSELVNVIFQKFNAKQFANFNKQAAKYCNGNPNGTAELDALNTLYGTGGGMPFWLKITIPVLCLVVIVLTVVAMYLGGVF